MARPVKAIISLSAFKHNFSIACNLSAPGKALAVIKANAYGHGAIKLALALPEAELFAVASLDEAMELRLAGIKTPILLLGGFFEASELSEITQFNLSVVIHNNWQLNTLTSASLPKPINAWLKLDSGMHRLGFQPTEFTAAYNQLKAAKTVKGIVLMSHFACADDPKHNVNRKQADTIQQCFSALATPTSIANSAALLTGLGGCADWSRPGIMLYGSNPVMDDCAPAQQLRPVMTLESKLMAVRTVEAGACIGYGHSWKASQPCRIGTVAIGYADGYPRHAPSGTPVLVNGQRTQLVGRVSMDMITVDLSHLPTANIGDSVELWGENLPVENIANLSGTISYELLAGIAPRVPRVY